MRASLLTRCDLKAVEADGATGTFEGYGSVFDVEDWYGHIVRKGAFTATLAKAKAEKRMPALLWQHSASTPIGVWDEMREDDRGLYVRGRLADTTQGRDVHTLLKMGALDGLSIGFTPITVRRDDKADTLELLEVDLWEVSPVTFPANELARVTDIKGLGMAEDDFTRLLRHAGFSQDDAQRVITHGFRGARRPEPDLAQLCANLNSLAATMRPTTGA